MPVVLVGPGDQVVPALQRVIGDDADPVDTDGPETPRVGPEQLSDLLRGGGPGLDCSRGVEELLLLELVITAEEDQERLVIGHVHQGLDLPVGGSQVGMGLGQGADRAQPGSGEALQGRRVGIVAARHGRDRTLDVGAIAAIGAGDDPVFAGIAPDHELHRLRAAHGPRRGLDVHRVETHPGEDALIGATVLLEADVEPGSVDVERVGVLHRELADTEEARFGPRLVPVLGVHLIPDLGQIAV